MKIFQVVPYYPPHIGGMEVYVEYLSRKLVEKGHEVKVFTSSDKPYSYREIINGVEVCRIRVSAKVYNVPVANSLLNVLLNEEKPDVLHTHQYPVYFSDMTALASYLRKVPLFLHVHVIPEPKSSFSGFVQGSYYRTFEKFTLKASHCVIVPSEAYKVMLTKIGVDSKKISVVPCGVDLTRFNPTESGETFKKRFNLGGSKVILTVGRLNYQKGYQYLLKAMPAIIHHFPDVKLVFVGEGELLSYLDNLSFSLGINKNVVFTGSLSSREISGAYAAADVFVLSSIFESFGISLLEAQATGKPVVGTRVGGLPEALVEGKSGILVEPKRPKDLALAIITLLRDRRLAQMMGQFGRRFVESYQNSEKRVDQVIELYDSPFR